MYHMGCVLFKLKGDKFDILTLSSYLHNSTWQIVDEDNIYYLYTKISDENTDYRLILKHGEEYLHFLNGAMKIVYPDLENVKIESFKIIKENGSKHYVMLCSPLKIRSRLHASLSKNGSAQDFESQTNIDFFIQKALQCKSVKDVLHFMNNVTWSNLYKIFEIIRDDLGGQTAVETIIPKVKLSSFTQAAQSREYIGDEARHASSKFKRPKNEISLNEAHKIIAQLISSWVTNKQID